MLCGVSPPRHSVSHSSALHILVHVLLCSAYALHVYVYARCAIAVISWLARRNLELSALHVLTHGHVIVRMILAHMSRPS